MKLLSLIIALIVLCGFSVAIGYGLGTQEYYQFVYEQPIQDGELIDVGECIASSRSAAMRHNVHIDGGERDSWNIYWRDLHNSCAYWLEELRR